VVTHQYSALGSTTAGLRSIFVNSTTTTSYTQSPYAIRQQTSGNNAIGGNPVQTTWPGNFQMYNFYVFNTAIDNGTNRADRQLIEATPYSFTAVPNTITLTITSVTATNFVLSTSTVTGANQFVVFVNGSATYISATGLTALSSVTLTPHTPGPWALNVYAYNASNILLATGYTMPGYATIINASGFGGVQFGGAAVPYMNAAGMNDAGTKLVFGTNSTFSYSYYNGTNWITAANFSGVSNSTYFTGALTADGTRGVIGNYWFPWTGTTPGSLTSFGTAPSGGRTFTKLTADGSRLFMQSNGTMGFYTWNGTTYASFTSITGLTNLNTNSSIAISPDGTYIAYTSGTSTAVSASTPAFYFAKWNGSNYTNETANVCSAFGNLFNSYTLSWGDFCIGYNNVLYVAFTGGTSNFTYFIAFAFNPITGYFDKYNNVQWFGNTNGFVAASRLANPGVIMFNTGGNLFTSPATIT
jgi:hypothetical protein